MENLTISQLQEHLEKQEVRIKNAEDAIATTAKVLREMGDLFCNIHRYNLQPVRVTPDNCDRWWDRDSVEKARNNMKLTDNLNLERLYSTHETIDPSNTKLLELILELQDIVNELRKK